MRLRSPITFIGISLRINTMKFSTHRFYQNYTIKTIYTIVFCDMALPMWICSTKAFFILSKMRSTVLFSGGYGSAKAKRETLPRTISHHFDNLLLEIYLFRALLSIIYVTVAMLNIFFLCCVLKLNSKTRLLIIYSPRQTSTGSRSFQSTRHNLAKFCSTNVSFPG